MTIVIERKNIQKKFGTDICQPCKYLFSWLLLPIKLKNCKEEIQNKHWKKEIFLSDPGYVILLETAFFNSFCTSNDAHMYFYVRYVLVTTRAFVFIFSPQCASGLCVPSLF